MEKPTSPSPLESFVRAAKQQGAGDEFLASLLSRHGWSADDIYAALGSYWQAATGLDIPRRGSGTENSREAFLCLLSFLTLAVWATALGTILFQLVNVWSPDPLAPGYAPYIRTTVTWSMAAMAVSFPIYFLVTRVQVREAVANPGRLHTGVRKWITYMALLITAGTVVGDLIGVAGYFLLGELTLRFALKALIVLVICGAIFAFYLGSLPGAPTARWRFGRAHYRIFAAGSLLAVCLAFLAGIIVAGNPADQRRMQADLRRVDDLHQIALAVDRWRDAQRTQAAIPAPESSAPPSAPAARETGLPESLDLLRQQQRLPRIEDPETRKPYGYQVLGGDTYQLCAVFATEFPREGERAQRHGEFWNHPAGEHCFVLDAAKPVPW